MDVPLLFVVGLVVLVLLVAAWIWHERTWVTVYTSPAGNASEAMRLVGELESEGVRTRYRAPRAGFLPNQGLALRAQIAEVKVHRDDTDRAHAVRARMDELEPPA